MEPPKQKTRGIRNNNPLNIEKGASWLGLSVQQTDPRFCQFTTMLYGLRAAFLLIRNYMRHYPIDTISGIINRWAPPKENDTASYIRTVSQRSHIAPDEKLKFTNREKMVAIVSAMSWVESSATFETDLLNKAYALALKA